MNIPTRKKRQSVGKKLLLAKQRFLGGKALKRIEYFETQRALSKTTLVKHTGPVVTTSRLSQAGAQAFLFHPRIQTTSFSAPLAADFGKPWIRGKHGDH